MLTLVQVYVQQACIFITVTTALYETLKFHKVQLVDYKVQLTPQTVLYEKQVHVLLFDATHVKFLKFT